MLSCQPLTILMHEEGVAWIADQHHDLQRMMAEEDGESEHRRKAPHKIWTLHTVLDKMSKRCDATAEELHIRLKDCIIKAMMSVQAGLIFKYKVSRPLESSF